MTDIPTSVLEQLARDYGIGLLIIIAAYWFLRTVLTHFGAEQSKIIDAHERAITRLIAASAAHSEELEEVRRIVEHHAHADGRDHRDVAEQLKELREAIQK